MSIRNRLQLNSLVSLTMMSLAMLSVGWSLWTTSQARQKDFLVSRILQAAVERTVLRDEYLLFEEKREVRQWKGKTDELRQLLKTAEERLTKIPDRELLEEIKESFAGTASIFPRLLEMRAGREAVEGKGLPYSEGEKSLIAQLLLKAYSLVHQIDRLHESVQKASAAAYQRLVLLIVVLMVVSAIITIWNSMVINGNLVKRIAELREGFEIMGAGNLDHRLGVKGDDELSALAKAGNEMAGKLKESHTSVTNLNREIAERKNAEEKLSRLYETLEKSEERFRLLVEQAPDAIAVFDVDENRFIQANFQAEKLFGCSREDLLKSGPWRFYTPIQPNGRPIDESRKESRERVLAGEEVVIERAIHNAEGKKLICDLRLVRLPSADRRLIRNSFIDITERKQAEEKVKASLLEKETMLKEIHHRVKNNLQVIQSLLNLQAMKIKDPQSLEIINQSRDRIRAMALVHEKLYKSPDLAQIDMTDYLQGLSIGLFHSSQVSPHKVKLKLKMEEVQLGINEAIPLGLILNELVSNALKHAFPRGREGEIRVGLALVDEGLIRLSVRDNGIGLPGEVDFHKAESMGFQVVSALVQQLGGSIELDREVGTEFRITFLEGIK